MNPLFDLKERLHQSAMAGTDLLNEDFRLKKMAEQIAPLSAKNPIFKKINDQLSLLFSATPEERPLQLIKTISLVDAVVATQATYKVEGEITSLPSGNGKYYDISYLQLKPIIEALTTKGSGRYDVLHYDYNQFSKLKNYEQTEAFQILNDFRLRKYLIEGLDDSYADLADLVADILSYFDESIVEELKADFDVKGKKCMARRLKVIYNIAKEKEQDLYKYAFENGSASVRKQAIQCLSGLTYLMEIYKKSKGETKIDLLDRISNFFTTETDDFWENFWSKENISNNSKYIYAKKTARVSKAVVDKACELFNTYMYEQYESKEYKLSDIIDKNTSDKCIKFIADRMADLNNTIKVNYIDSPNDIPTEEELRKYSDTIQKCRLPEENKKSEKLIYEHQFWQIIYALNGCCLEEIFRFISYISPLLSHLFNFRNFRKSYFDNLFQNLNDIVIKAILENPDENMAKGFIELYRIYGEAYAEMAFVSLFIINPNATYQDFIDLRKWSSTYIIDNGEVKASETVPFNADKNYKVLEAAEHIFEKLIYKEGIYYYSNNYHENAYYALSIYSAFPATTFDISWIEKIRLLKLTPKTAYKIIKNDINDKTIDIVNDYMHFVIKDKKSDSKAVATIMIILGKAKPEDIFKEYLLAVVNSDYLYIDTDLFRIFLRLIKDDSQKIMIINEALDILKQKKHRGTNYYISKLLEYQKNIQEGIDPYPLSDEEMQKYLQNIIKSYNYY